VFFKFYLFVFLCVGILGIKVESEEELLLLEGLEVILLAEDFPLSTSFLDSS
jgi:hypothetical protein